MRQLWKPRLSESTRLEFRLGHRHSLLVILRWIPGLLDNTGLVDNACNYLRQYMICSTFHDLQPFPPRAICLLTTACRSAVVVISSRVDRVFRVSRLKFRLVMSGSTESSSAVPRHENVKKMKVSLADSARDPETFDCDICC